MSGEDRAETRTTAGRGDLVETWQMPSRGQSYEALVPDTLDLAEQGRLAINALTGHVEPAKAYGVYQVFGFDQEPKLGGLTWNLPAKDARVLPMLRAMTGSAQNLEVEAGLMHALRGHIRDDGLAYVPIDNDGAPRGTAYPYANGLLALAARSWHARDGNPTWLEVASRISKALRRIAIQVEDRAYYPPESSYNPDGSWAWTMRGEATLLYRPPAEPDLEQQGLEGCVKYEQASALRALVKDYEADSDPATMQMIQKIVRFMLKPGMWEDTAREGYLGNEHGIFAGHFHGNITALHALFEVGLAQNDAWLKQFVREAYDHARRTGVARMGWYPGMLRPSGLTWQEYGRDSKMFVASETCGVADMLVLAVKLADAGMGDYWDDVDAIARNHLVAQQLTDWDQIERLGGGSSDREALLRRMVGGFGQSMDGWINSCRPRMFGCCTANGSVALYYAWHGITRFDEQQRVATVNLLLNRASAWMDIDSCLPYEGRVVLHNKQARTALVRLPSWADRSQLKCFVDDTPVQPALSGSYLLFTDLIAQGMGTKASVIRLEFPVATTTERQTIGDRQYVLTFRSSTVVDITPRDPAPNRYQYYLRQAMLGNAAPQRAVRRFVADKLIPLQ